MANGLNAADMAKDIAKAIDLLSLDPTFKARCFAGADVTTQTWTVICQVIINHLQQNMKITIPSLTVSAGIPVVATAGLISAAGATSGPGSTVSTSVGVVVQ